MPSLLIEAPEAVGHPLHLITYGHGPMMLALHGGLGLDHTSLRPGLDPLADQLQLVYLDIRGNGRSRSADRAWVPLSMDQLVRDVESVRRALGADRMLLFGHSFGSAIAQEYALMHPERVQGLVLCNGYADFDVGDLAARAAHRGTPEARKAFTALLSGAATSDDDFAALFREFFPLYCHTPALAPTHAFNDWQPSLQAFLDSATHLMPSFSTRGRLGTLKMPALVIGSADDFAAPPQLSAEILAKELPNAELVIFEESGHFPFLEEPGRFERVMRAWLAQVIEEMRA